MEYSDFGDFADLGAIVVKSLSAACWNGNPAPRLAPIDPAGSMINAVGLPNPGVAEWSRSILPKLVETGANVVASLWGHTTEELLEAIDLMAQFGGPSAWELNMSCPNLSTSGQLASHDPAVASMICAEARKVAPPSVGIWAKLSPDAPDVPAVASACEEAGVDAVTLCNTFPELMLNPVTGRPYLANGVGGKSGAALRPIVQRHVVGVRRACPDLGIVAAGGVLSAGDAMDYLSIGADAVQVGTANFANPRATFIINRAVRQLMSSQG